jgi:hypothetical protein
MKQNEETKKERSSTELKVYLFLFFKESITCGERLFL